jgi:iron(III) transport system permease protein
MAMIAEERRWGGFLTTRNTVLLLVTALVAFLVALPILFLLWGSLKESGRTLVADLSLGNLTLRNFVDAYSDPQIIRYLGNSLNYAAGSMVVALLFGCGIAFLVERTNAPFRNVSYGLMFIPLIMPSMVKAIAWVFLLSPTSGLLNKVWLALGFTEPLFNAYSWPAMWWVTGLSHAPLAFFMMGAAFRGMDPSLEEAAYTAGGSKVTTFYRITLKLMAPALAAVALLMFVRGLEGLDVPLIMGSSHGMMVYATQIYAALKMDLPPSYGEAFVLSIGLIFLAFIGLFFYQRVLTHGERYATVTGKGYRPRLIGLGKWRTPAGAFIMFFLFAAVILPFLVLLWTSLLPFFEAPSRAALGKLTLINYIELFERYDFLLSVKNTVILGAVVSIGGMLLATLISWIVLRLKPKGARVLDSLAFVPFTIPSVALGFSFMVFFLYVTIIPVYDTIWIMVLAYMIAYLPIGTRFTHSGMVQIHKELEDAAATSGAGFFTVLRRIIVPLLIPSLVAGGLYVLMLTVRLFSIAAILYNPDTTVLSVLVYELWWNGSFPQVGALAVLFVLFLLIVVIISRKLAQRRSMVAET